MTDPILSIREMQESDLDLILDYWFASSAEYLAGMGADINKLPERQAWRERLGAQLGQSYPEKQSYAIIWEVDGLPVGHSNLNPIHFGDEANMHLHLWQAATRRRGLGADLVRLTLPFFFDNMELQRLYCEPFAHNPAPNKTMAKVGFELVKTYVGVPGSINSEQLVNQWLLTRKQCRQLGLIDS